MELENYDDFPQSLPLIIEDDIFLYPFMIAPIFLSDEQNLKSVQESIDNNKLVIVSVSKPGFEKKRGVDGYYDVGVVGNIMRKITLPDGRVKILFQGLAKGNIKEVTKSSPISVMTSLLEIDKYDKIKVDEIVKTQPCENALFFHLSDLTYEKTLYNDLDNIYSLKNFQRFLKNPLFHQKQRKKAWRFLLILYSL